MSGSGLGSSGEVIPTGRVGREPMTMLDRAAACGLLGPQPPQRDDLDRAVSELWTSGHTRFAGVTLELVDRDEWLR